MEEAMATRYWCHMCSQMVNPIMEVEIKCPFCQSGFVEEMSSNSVRDIQDSVPDFGNDHRALSLWAPILMGMMNNPVGQRRNRRTEFGEDGDRGNDNTENEEGEARNGRETDLDRELEEILRRRRRSSAAILQLLQGIRAGLASESENDETSRDNMDRDRERERVILINPFNQTIMVQGSYDLNPRPIGSLGDYFIGPGLDMLLQHLAENDPNMYGTPPAQKEAVEALTTMKIAEPLQCSVCLDDFEIGAEAKEMPCKHKFHRECLLPWLELHSSCPVCRYQLPADETKVDSERSRNYGRVSSTSITNENENGNGDGRQEEGEESNGRRFSFPWPFSSLFSSSRDNNPSSNSGSQSATGSRADEN